MAAGAARGGDFRTLLEHTNHPSPGAELAARRRADEKMKIALHRIGLDGNGEDRA